MKTPRSFAVAAELLYFLVRKAIGGGPTAAELVRWLHVGTDRPSWAKAGRVTSASVYRALGILERNRLAMKTTRLVILEDEPERQRPVWVATQQGVEQLKRLEEGAKRR